MPSSEFLHDADGLHLRFDAMGTANELLLDGLPPAQARAAAEQAMAEVRRIEAKYSRYRADSLLSRINAAAGSGQPIAVDEETAGLLNFADQLHRQSDGRFDISSGSLRQVWDFKAGRRPGADALAGQLRRVGWQRVRWDGQQIALPQVGMEIDFGGIGKEYAADRAAAVLARHGLRHGFVNLGGDIRVLGPHADGRAWRFGIQHPRIDAEVCAQIELSQGALATSGDYERFFIDPDGQRCCHILDARTGLPVQHWQAVSVVAPVCVAAGALATLAMLMGTDALALLQVSGVAFLGVDAQGRLRRQDLDSSSTASFTPS